MHEYLKASGTYGISILHEGQQELCQHFAGRPIEGLTIAFEDIDGIPVIKDALAHITAEIVDAHEAGDHTLFIGRVRYIAYKEGLHPLLFCQGRYGQVSLACRDVAYLIQSGRPYPDRSMVCSARYQNIPELPDTICCIQYGIIITPEHISTHVTH